MRRLCKLHEKALRPALFVHPAVPPSYPNQHNRGFWNVACVRALRSWPRTSAGAFALCGACAWQLLVRARADHACRWLVGWPLLMCWVYDVRWRYDVAVPLCCASVLATVQSAPVLHACCVVSRTQGCCIELVALNPCRFWCHCVDQQLAWWPSAAALWPTHSSLAWPMAAPFAHRTIKCGTMFGGWDDL